MLRMFNYFKECEYFKFIEGISYKGDEFFIKFKKDIDCRKILKFIENENTYSQINSTMSINSRNILKFSFDGEIEGHYVEYNFYYTGKNKVKKFLPDFEIRTLGLKQFRF